LDLGIGKKAKIILATKIELELLPGVLKFNRYSGKWIKNAAATPNSCLELTWCV
jgi:hypothetical protein